MPAPPTLKQVIAAVTDALAEVDGIGQVDTTPGCASPWSKTGQPAAQWWAEVTNVDQAATTIPGAADALTLKIRYLIQIEGWHPVSGVSEATWRPLLDAVMLRLERLYSLGLDLQLVQGPILASDKQLPKSSLHAGDTTRLCHYAKIALRWSTEYGVTVTG